MRARQVRFRTALPTRLIRFAALVAALGQLVVAFAAWGEAVADRGGDARAHIEQDGTRLHHVHVESQCALCAAQHLVARPSAASSGELPARPALLVGTHLFTAAPAPTERGVHLSRAPPPTS